MPAYRQYPSFVAGDQIVGFTSLRHSEQIVIVRIARDTRRLELFEQYRKRSHSIDEPSGLRRMDTTANRGIAGYARKLLDLRIACDQNEAVV